MQVLLINWLTKTLIQALRMRGLRGKIKVSTLEPPTRLSEKYFSVHIVIFDPSGPAHNAHWKYTHRHIVRKNIIDPLSFLVFFNSFKMKNFFNFTKKKKKKNVLKYFLTHRIDWISLVAWKVDGKYSNVLLKCDVWICDANVQWKNKKCMKSRDSLERDGTLGKSYIPDETLHYPRQRDGTTAHLVARDILHVLGQAVLAIFPTSRLDSLPYTRSTLYASHDPINQSFLHFLFFFLFYLSAHPHSIYTYTRIFPYIIILDLHQTYFQ